MKVVYLICNQVYMPRVMELLAHVGIDYYTCWEHVKGKGHGTEAHLGTRSFPNMNAVIMIAIQEEEVLEKLAASISAFNGDIVRPDDRLRLFQVPLERII
jgi:nitrogen regulatory protein PII